MHPASLVGGGTPRSQIVFVNSDERALEKAKADDLAAVAGDAANAHPLRQSGADSVITSSGAAGRLLGLAIETPQLVAVIEDLLSVGEGLDIIEQPVVGEQARRRLSDFDQRKLALAVVRGEDLLRFGDPRAERLEADDACLCNQDTPD